MNLVGKIFVVLIMLMSFVFMGFAVAVYATHQNWDQIVNSDGTKGPPGLKKQLDEARTRRLQLEAQLNQLTEQHATELNARQEALTKLTTEADLLRREHDQLVNEHATLVTQARDAVAAMATTHQTLAAMRTELETLRDDIRKAQTDRDEQFNHYVKLTDDFNQAQGELKRLQDQFTTLADQINKYRLVANRLKVNLDSRPEALPPKVDGLVLASGKDGMVEISLGSDDGIERGNKLEVSRGGRYLGRIEVFHTSPDKSVAKVLPEFRKGPIEKNDHVAIW